MQLRLPRRLAGFNRVVTNPIQRQYAWLLPPWAVICHRGRRSGRSYRTPVVAFTRGGIVAVAVLYGEDSDWVKNVLAGGGSLVRAGRTYELVNPRVVSPRRMAGLPALARATGRVSDRLLVAEMQETGAGFGRGPKAA